MTPEHAVESIIAWNRAGWSVGDAAFVGELGHGFWVVSGRNEGNIHRAKGSTPAEARWQALEQARSLSMLGRRMRW